MYDNLKMYNPENTNEIKVIRDWDLGFHDINAYSSISTNNIIIGRVGFGIGLYDLSSNKMILTKNDDKFSNCILSPDGKYAFNFQYPVLGDRRKINFYEITEANIQLIGELPLHLYFQANWIPGSGHQLYTIEGNATSIPDNTETKFIIYNAITQDIASEISVTNGTFAGVDITHKQVAFWDQIPGTDRKNKIYIYNYETGVVEKTIPLTPDINKLYFWNSYLFSSEGFSIKIDNY
jgi:hypothetical protein